MTQKHHQTKAWTLRQALSLLIALFLIISLSACGGKNKTLKIGIVQLIEHKALNAAYEGIIEALEEGGFVDGDTVEIDLQNAQGDQSNLKAIADRFVGNQVDLIFAIATPAAQSMAASTSSIPIVGTAITDYEAAKLVDTNEKPGRNVTGSSDMNPIAEQLDLILELMPNLERLGVLYNASEINSEIQVQILKELADAKGLPLDIQSLASLNDVQQVITPMLSRVGAFYLPTDNLLASSIPLVTGLTKEAKLPVFAGERYMVESGAFASLGIDYKALGKQAGEMGRVILEGLGKPQAMPIQWLENFQLSLRVNEAQDYGIVLSEALLDSIDEVE